MTAVTTLDDAPSATVTSSDGKQAVEAAQLIKHHDDLSGERRIITIHQDAGLGDEGKHAVFVGLNGVGYHIPRAKPVNVPLEVVNNLENARYTQYGRDEKGGITTAEVPRFAMNAMPAAPVGKAARKAEADSQKKK